MERVRSADADRTDDVGPGARADLRRQGVVRAGVRNGLEGHVDLVVGRVERLDDLLLDGYLLRCVAAAQAAVPADVDLAGRGRAAGDVMVGAGALPDRAAPLAAGGLLADDPHAPTIRAMVATRAKARNGLERMSLLAVVPGRGWLGTSRCRVIGASSRAASGADPQLSPAGAGQPADAGTRARLLHRGGQ